MRAYQVLSATKICKDSYAMKFFVALFPLVFLLLILLVFQVLIWLGKINLSIPNAVCIELILTALAGYTCFYFFRQLIAPLTMAKDALDDYEVLRQLPMLPTEYRDEAGALMASIQSTISKMDRLISEKTDMIDLLSHDLRSPVGRILSLVELINIDPEDNKELYCRYISKECKGLLRMLENILVMLKDDHGDFSFAYISLNQIVHETISFFDFSISEKKLRISTDIDDAIMVHVQTDLFMQCLRNIIGNAIKFSPDGKTIRMVARIEKEQVYLSVVDEGMGFKPGDIQYLFERFTTVGKPGAKGEASTGLGLYLSKKIVERHGGALKADSAGVNKGATFTIILNNKRIDDQGS